VNWRDFIEEVVPESEVMTLNISWRGRGKPRSVPIGRACDREKVGNGHVGDESRHAVPSVVFLGVV
jgi:hypothetical protein